MQSQAIWESRASKEAIHLLSQLVSQSAKQKANQQTSQPINQPTMDNKQSSQPISWAVSSRASDARKSGGQAIWRSELENKPTSRASQRTNQ